MAPCILMEVDRRFRSAYFLHYQVDDVPDGPDDGGSTHVWNIFLILRDYRALFLRRLMFSLSVTYQQFQVVYKMSLILVTFWKKICWYYFGYNIYHHNGLIFKLEKHSKRKNPVNLFVYLFTFLATCPRNAYYGPVDDGTVYFGIKIIPALPTFFFEHCIRLNVSDVLAPKFFGRQPS